MRYFASFVSMLFVGVHSFHPETLPGVSKPLGFFDPLNLAKGKTEIEFKKWQENEIKHSRVAMLATVGLLVQKQFHPVISGEIGESIYHWQIIANKYPSLTAAIIFIIASFELYSIPKSWQMTSVNGIADLNEDYTPGNLLFNFIKDEEKLKDLQTKEINNGRLAMIASIIIILQQYFNTH